MNSHKQQARELLQGRSLIFKLSQGQSNPHNPELYKRFVEMAAEFGATHIEVGRLPYRHGTQFLPDNHDPYAAWCNTSPGLLWCFPNEELQQWISGERAQEHFAEQLDVLRQFGLKGVLDGLEPMWLPEEIYRAHPRWRGAQCELARIARRPYFAPCIDEPEVLSLYSSAMQELCTKFPEIDQFNFMSNDSGAGIDWTPNTYPGMNGHNRYRGRDAGTRIATWLQALQDGAEKAGQNVRVHLHSSGLSPEIKRATVCQLKDGQYLNWMTCEGGQPWGGAGASLGGGVWNFTYPAAGMNDPGAFVAGLQNVFSNPKKDSVRVSVNIDESNLDNGRVLLEEFFKAPGTGSVHHAELMLASAGNFCGGPEHAETLVSAWKSVERAVHAIGQVRQKGFGHVLPFCGVSMRWITRPLVPQPALLSPEETEYFQKFWFSVEDGDQKHNLCNVLGKPVFRGESAMWMARWALHEAITTLRGTQSQLESLAKKLEGDAAKTIALYAARVGATACCAHTAQNVIRFQYALDVAHHPQFGWNVMDYDENILYDQRGQQLRKIAREELDNIEMLIELMESQEEPVVIFAAKPEDESVFMLGPNLKADLRKKMNIMLDHWQEYETLYPATKVWELEPRPPLEVGHERSV